MAQRAKSGIEKLRPERPGATALRRRRVLAGLAGAAIALLCLFGAVPGPSGTACAEEGADPVPFPPGTTSYGGMPPLMPGSPSDADAVRALCDAWTDAGRRARGTRRGGDMLFSAAGALYDYIRDRERPFALYADAFDAYPAGDPTRGVVLLHHARREMGRGNVPKAQALAAALVPWESARAPRDLGPGDLRRWEELAAALREELPQLRAELHEANGELLAAAEALAGMLVDEAVELHPGIRTMLWERVARLRHRGGDRPSSLEAIDRALQFTEEGTRERAKLAFWRLHARHGLVAPDGGPFLPRTWPGDAYERDVRVYLREIQGVEGVGTKYLSLGSSALMANRLEIALEIYLLALRAPDLVEAARRNAMIWRGLLAAVPAAIELERFDDAERLLSTIERIADEPLEQMDQLRILIREGRAEKKARAAKAHAEAEPGPEAGAPPAPRRRPLGTLATEDATETEAGESADPASPQPPDGTPSWLWIASGACLLVGLAALLGRIGRQRKSRARTKGP